MQSVSASWNFLLWWQTVHSTSSCLPNRGNFGEIVVKACVFDPWDFIMARAAVFPLAALVRIVVFVAINASNVRADLSPRAPNDSLRRRVLAWAPRNGKFSIPVMTECCGLARMYQRDNRRIAFRCVPYACRLSCGRKYKSCYEFWFKQRVRVTRCAFYFRVAAAERKSGFPPVIEYCCDPAWCVMATFTIRAKLSLCGRRPLDGSQRILPEGLHRYCRYGNRRIWRCGAFQKVENRFFRDQNLICSQSFTLWHDWQSSPNWPLWGIVGFVTGNALTRAHRETFSPPSGTRRNRYFYAHPFNM